VDGCSVFRQHQQKTLSINPSALWKALISQEQSGLRSDVEKGRCHDSQRNENNDRPSAIYHRPAIYTNQYLLSEWGVQRNKIKRRLLRCGPPWHDSAVYFTMAHGSPAHYSKKNSETVLIRQQQWQKQRTVPAGIVRQVCVAKLDLSQAFKKTV